MVVHNQTRTGATMKRFLLFFFLAIIPCTAQIRWLPDETVPPQAGSSMEVKMSLHSLSGDKAVISIQATEECRYAAARWILVVMTRQTVKKPPDKI